MLKRLIAIAFIFGCTSAAWMILGGVTMARTTSSDERLRDKVESVWGAPHTQTAPLGEYTVAATPVDITRELRPAASNIAVTLQSEPRQKGLLWYPTYKVNFRGEFQFRNSEDAPKAVRVSVPFPAARAVYDDLAVQIDGQPVPYKTENNRATVAVDARPGQSFQMIVSYRSQGLESWKYSFGDSVNPVDNFHLRITTNFRDVDFPDNTLAPETKRETKDGWQLDWNYQSLVSGYQIAVKMPEKLQPGPLASEISFFAPVSLFFFFFALFIITTLREIELHPMNYFFLAAAFFAFHLLMAYLADHLDIHATFVISSAVSVFLVVSYLRLVTGAAFALREAAIAQVIYLVLFSYAFFFKGLTGLAITIGAIITLFVVMQMTGRIRWAEKFSPALWQGVLR